MCESEVHCDDGSWNKILGKQTSSILTGTCKKCSFAGTLFKLPFRQPECRSCFVSHIRHKFKAAIGASKILPYKACVLVLFDSSLEAIALLDMLQDAKKKSNFKRLSCTTKVLYIDDRIMSVTKRSPQEHQEYFLKVNKYCSQYGECYVIPFSKTINVFSLASEELSKYMERNTSNEDSFMADIKSIKTLTSRQDFMKMYRSQLITTAATSLNCEYVFAPDNCDRLAAQFLSAVALGRGNSVSLDVAFLDERLGANMKLLRPIRDINSIEIEMYVNALCLKASFLDNVIQFGDIGSSVQQVTRTFVANLQRKYSSTVPTVYRTGCKIAPVSNGHLKIHAPDFLNEGALANCCSFCNSPLDCGTSLTPLVLKYSSHVSKNNISFFDKYSDDTDARSGLSLCHGCDNIRCETNLKLF